MQCHCTRRPVLRNRVLWTWEIVTKILPAGRLSGKQDRSNVKGLKGETPEIQDTLAQSMTGGSVRLEAETVLCETTEDEKQKKKPRSSAFRLQFLLGEPECGIMQHSRPGATPAPRTGLGSFSLHRSPDRISESGQCSTLLPPTLAL